MVEFSTGKITDFDVTEKDMYLFAKKFTALSLKYNSAIKAIDFLYEESKTDEFTERLLKANAWRTLLEITQILGFTTQEIKDGNIHWN